MKNHRRTYLLTALALCALMAGAATAHAYSNKTAVKKGASWIRKSRLSNFPGTGFKSDTVSALVAARKAGASVKSSAVDRFLDEIRDETGNYAQSAGPAGKVALAVTATGRNPRCFGPKGNESDLIGIIRADYNGKGRYGSTVYDQALAMLALKAAHEDIPDEAVKFVRGVRGKYGWNFQLRKTSGDEVESTAIMIEAMRAAGVSKKDGGLRSAYKWITYQRNLDHGYNPDGPANNPELPTQADTTAYAIRAADALGINASKSKTALRALQQRNGAIRSTPTVKGDYMGISTANGVLALSGQHYPVRTLSKAGQSCV